MRNAYATSAMRAADCTLPPGTYNVVAVDYIENGAWGDPELLERLKPRAKRVTLSEGASERVDLKLTEQY